MQGRQGDCTDTVNPDHKKIASMKFIDHLLLRSLILHRILYLLVPLLRDRLDAIRSRVDVSPDLVNDYRRTRGTSDYNLVFEKKSPLISICVATYNRADLLVDRCLHSILSQDYNNIEVIVVGDCCTDHTSERIAEINDPRLTFVNLPERGTYPTNPQWRWMVAGTAAINHALMLARGDFIAHLDDDDRYAPHRIRSLVDFAQDQRADLVWHPFLWERYPDQWVLNQAEALARTKVTTSALFYHRWLARIPWDVNAYLYREPGDYNRIRKLKFLGINAQRFPEPLLWHYKERSQTKI